MAPLHCLYTFLWTVLMSFCLVPFLPINASGDGDGPSSCEQVRRLTTEFWDWRLRIAPEYATKFGLRIYNDKLEQFTEEAMQEQVKQAEKFLVDIEKVSRQHLDSQEAISLEVLKDLLTTFIEGYRYRRYGAYLGVSVFDNPLIEMKKVVTLTKFETNKDYQAVLRRYRAFVTYLEQKQTLLKLAIERGLTGPVSSLKASLNGMNSFPSDPEETFFYEPFTRINDTRLAPELQRQAKEIIRNEVMPALQNYTEFLKREYVPRARTTIGAWALPNGREFYRACLRWHLSLDLTPQEIFDMGKAEVARISGKIKELMHKDNFDGDLRSYIALLKNKTENMFNTQDEMLQQFKDDVQMVRRQLDKILLKIPKAAMSVQVVDSPNNPTGRYIEPSLDGNRGGVFYANTYYPTTRPRFGVMALTLHEAEPGHHTQSAYLIEEDIPNFRRAIEFRKYYAVPFNWPFYTAYIEGWALYAESLGEEMGLYKNPKSLLGRYTSEILRACRLVVDTGIHEFKWSFKEAKEYLQKYTLLPETQIETEVKRYSSYPGQATSYKVGELTIKRLRREAEKKLGNKFDLRQFHDSVLRLGPVPMTTLETHIHDWVNAQLPAASISGGAPLCQTSAPVVFLCLVSLLACLKWN